MNRSSGSLTRLRKFWLAHKAKEEVGAARTNPRDIDVASDDKGCEGVDGSRNPSQPERSTERFELSTLGS
jgi:hypothetical protein